MTYYLKWLLAWSCYSISQTKKNEAILSVVKVKLIAFLKPTSVSVHTSEKTVFLKVM